MADAEKKVTTGLVLDPVFENHDPGKGHPESVMRYKAISARLKADKLDGSDGSIHKIPIRVAKDEEIIACHEKEYVDLAVREIEGGAVELSTGDTSVCRDTLEVARKAAGSLMGAVDLVFSGKLENAFCAVRPPGHHARPAQGMGFCVFNNAAIAARYAQKKHGAERVAIIDWDVHHGNGTQDIFYEDGSVFFFSTHQSPWYPGTGAKGETGKGKGEGTTMNAPFPAGAGMGEVGGALADGFIPKMEKFGPDFIIISAGFDSRLGDPLGNFRLTDADFVELTKRVMGVADLYAEGRVVSVLEGGYNVDGLASAVSAHIRTLSGKE